jgi:hypothetical protein
MKKLMGTWGEYHFLRVSQPLRLFRRVINENTAFIKEKNEDKSKNLIEDDWSGHFWNGFAG